MRDPIDPHPSLTRKVYLVVLAIAYTQAKVDRESAIRT